MTKKLVLREYYEMCEGGVCQDHLTESEKIEVSNGATYLTGVMQKSDQLNGNGRIYPHNVLMREMKNYQKLIDERRALGELDHPEDSVVNLKNASHMVTDVWWNGNDVMGKIKVLNTPSGNILKSLVEGGVKLGISSRGLGSVHEDNNGNTIVEDDFQLICFDFVSEPSTPGAYMSVNESMEKQAFTKADRINRILNDIVESE
tara:strand:+ start:2708 stop:3316 length:609 start_codon:yes stop_codon:yes gene_type:complete